MPSDPRASHFPCPALDRMLIREYILWHAVGSPTSIDGLVRAKKPRSRLFHIRQQMVDVLDDEEIRGKARSA